ncbi:unnamed protein product, partial [Brugia timori]|uniref:Ovule protein n=1 Tax=Brugia timori TaxID=42155 RepID=A0A0R3RCU6_9BILA
LFGSKGRDFQYQLTVTARSEEGKTRQSAGKTMNTLKHFFWEWRFLRIFFMFQPCIPHRSIFSFFVVTIDNSLIITNIDRCSSKSISSVDFSLISVSLKK